MNPLDFPDLPIIHPLEKWWWATGFPGGFPSRIHPVLEPELCWFPRRRKYLPATPAFSMRVSQSKVGPIGGYIWWNMMGTWKSAVFLLDFTAPQSPTFGEKYADTVRLKPKQKEVVSTQGKDQLLMRTGLGIYISMSISSLVLNFSEWGLLIAFSSGNCSEASRQGGPKEIHPLSKIVLIGWIVRGSQPLTLSFGAESTRSVDYVDVGCIISYNVHVLLLNWILGAKIIIVIHIYIFACSPKFRRWHHVLRSLLLMNNISISTAERSDHLCKIDQFPF